MIHRFLMFSGLAGLIWAVPKILAHMQLRTDFAQSICGNSITPNAYAALLGSCDTACYIAIGSGLVLSLGLLRPAINRQNGEAVTCK